MIWNNIKEKIPPYDTLVLCKGTSEYGCPVYCLAFNQCYDEAAMTPVYDSLPIESQNKLTYGELFEINFMIEFWTKID